MNKHKHDIDFTMTNGVEAEAYIPPYLFISENTVQVQVQIAQVSHSNNTKYTSHLIYFNILVGEILLFLFHVI